MTKEYDKLINNRESFLIINDSIWKSYGEIFDNYYDFGMYPIHFEEIQTNSLEYSRFFVNLSDYFFRIYSVNELESLTKLPLPLIEEFKKYFEEIPEYYYAFHQLCIDCREGIDIPNDRNGYLVLDKNIKNYIVLQINEKTEAFIPDSLKYCCTNVEGVEIRSEESHEYKTLFLSENDDYPNIFMSDDINFKNIKMFDELINNLIEIAKKHEVKLSMNNFNNWLKY